ncbi:unnamed protein product [marine sediment metagenome]|uniref:Uncharacterized protein n=1 Tax=marine sediment metagenome TaxID=412755 RepID=X1SQ06_9ZZZZ
MAKTRAIARRRNPARRRAGRKRGGLTLPLAVIGGFVPALCDLRAAYKFGGFPCALEHVSLCTTGYDPYDGKWKPGFAAEKLYGPLFLGVVVHKLAGRLGINRLIAQTGIPFFRI